MPPFKQEPPSDEEIKKRTMEIVERNKALAEERAKNEPAMQSEEQPREPSPVQPAPKQTRKFWWQKDDDKPEIKPNEDGTFSQVNKEGK